jgi:crossover junction endodeoxyribonuclease RusA
LLPRLKSESLALSIRFYFTSALRRDVDGGLKIAQDALCEGLGINDNRIVETHLYKNVDKTNPRIEVLLSTISHTEPSLVTE